MNFLSPNDHLPRNDSNGSTCEIQDGFLAGTLPVMYSVISTFGFFSNMLALWVFQFGTQKTNSITVYMKNLAISDLLLALCLPFRAAYQNENGPPILCKVVGTVFYTTMYISILLLSLICLDRYLKIIWPLQQFRIHKVPHSTSASRVVWLLCIAIMLPYFFNKGNSNDPCSHKCFHFKKRGALAAVLNMTAVLLFFFLLLFFLYSYCKISLKLHTASLRKSKRISSRATLKISVVLLVFTICFAPYHMVRVPYIFAQQFQEGSAGSHPWETEKSSSEEPRHVRQQKIHHRFQNAGELRYRMSDWLLGSMEDMQQICTTFQGSQTLG
uniref:G-protein coupled receptors family 1 profile domain-containing protein n=1 Tax=Podarcis muralis TaxID=64176 RepID=A0A670K9P0_PODMU